MSQDKKKKMPFPPVLKLLVRGYVIMGFVLLLEFLGIIDNVSLIIFTVTVISISMLFGVGYLLITYSKPVRMSSFDIPNTVLFFVKGGLVLYFVSLLGHFRLLPLNITSLLITAVAIVLMIIGVVSYLHEVVLRSIPIDRKTTSRYKSRRQLYRGSRW